MIKHIWNKPCLTNKEENRLKQGITKWKQGLCWETNTKGNMRQVQAVTPGEIPRLTICEVLVGLKNSTKCKTNYLDTGTNELPCAGVRCPWWGALAYILWENQPSQLLEEFVLERNSLLVYRHTMIRQTHPSETKGSRQPQFPGDHMRAPQTINHNLPAI